MIYTRPMLSSIAFAEGASSAGPRSGGLIGFLPFLFIFVIFYFLLIHPQRKKEKAHKELLSNLKKGDEVMTLSGIYGTIFSIKEDEVLLKVSASPEVKIKFSKSAIAGLSEKGENK